MSVEFTPIETGDMSKIPPAAPAGAWVAVAKVKQAATKDANLPMLIIEWKLVESKDGHEDDVGKSVADFLVFRPATDPNVRMSREQLKRMCEALDIEVPSVTRIESWDDLSDFIEALEGLKANVWTVQKKNAKTGEIQVSIQYTAPGRPAVAAEDDDAPRGKKTPAKKNGKRN
jgi:hypothetical protein